MRLRPPVKVNPHISDEELAVAMVDTLGNTGGVATSQSRPAEVYTNDLVCGAGGWRLRPVIQAEWARLDLNAAEEGSREMNQPAAPCQDVRPANAKG